MSPTIEIRRATSQDAASVASVLEQAFVEYRELYTDKGYAATVITADEVKARMAEGPMWVAIDNARIVGTVSATAKGAALYVRGMGIAPEARGKRLGQLLLQHVEAFAVANNYKKLTLSTTPFLLRAITLYEHFGFIRSEEATPGLFGTPLFNMFKNLSSSGI